MSETEKTKKEALIEPDLQRLIEIADFSNAVDQINKNLKTYHEKIISVKTSLNEILELLPMVIDEAEQIDKLEKSVLLLIKERLEKSGRSF